MARPTSRRLPPGSATDAVRQAVGYQKVKAPSGFEIQMDAANHHLHKPVVIGEINYVSTLPKTRSGKIMRRVLRAVTLDREPGDVSTIEDEGSVEDARQAWHQLKTEMIL